MSDYMPKGPRTGEEFLAAAERGEYNVAPSRDSWAVSAAGTVLMAATHPDKFSKEALVEAIQNLAGGLPTDLMVQGTMHAMTMADKVRGL